MSLAYLLDTEDAKLAKSSDTRLEKLAAKSEEPSTIVSFHDNLNALHNRYPATNKVSATAYIDNIPGSALIASSPDFDSNLFPTIIAVLVAEGKTRHKNG